jgi:hypothetical protein
MIFSKGGIMPSLFHRIALSLLLISVAGFAQAGETPVEPQPPAAPVVIPPQGVATPEVVAVLQAVTATAPATSAAIATLATVTPGTPEAFAAVATVSTAIATDLSTGALAVPALPPEILGQAIQILVGLELQLAASGYDASGLTALRAALESRGSAALTQP